MGAHYSSQRLDALCHDFVAKGHGTHVFAAGGSLDSEAPTLIWRHLPEDRDLFDLASLTKALVTTPLVHAEADHPGPPSGRASPASPGLVGTVGDWIGLREGASQVLNLNPPILDLRLDQILAHQSGLPAWHNFWMDHLGPGTLPSLPLTVEERRQRILVGLERCRPRMLAGGSFVYSDVGFILLGLILEWLHPEAALGRQFQAWCATVFGDQVAAASEMGFAAELAKRFGDQFRRRAIPTAYCPLRQRELVGEVHDENAAALGGIAGHAGLFGTGEGLIQYLRHLAASVAGERMLARNAAARQDTTNRGTHSIAMETGLVGYRQGLGTSAFAFGHGQAIGHLGFSGTGFWLWPERRVYAILLTNRVLAGRMPGPAIQDFRRETIALMAAALK